MFTRARLVAVAIVTTVLVVLPTATPEDATASAAPPGEPPNIVLITTDDQALSDLLWMPRTRELIGRQGFTFTQGLAPAPLCCPARAQLLTGQYSHNNGVRNNSGRHGGYDSLVDPGNTLASWLQDAGYRTGMVGKFLNGWSPGRHGVTPGWTHFNPASAGIFSGYGSTMFQHGQPQRYDDQHSNDVVTLSTMDLIDQWSEEAPFFVWTSFAAPHGTCSDTAPLCDAPPIPADRHRSAFANVTNVAEAKPSFNERDVSDKPAAVRNLKKVSRSKMQKLFTQRLRSLASVDEGVGAIVDKLREAGELDNTLIVFTSDNGYLTGEHRHSGKVLPFWESLRVPLLMRGPGIKPGRSSRMPATLVDLPSTLARAAGVAPGRRQDGLDLMRVAAGDGKWSKRDVLIEMGPRNKIGTRNWTYRGIYTSRYTFAAWERDGFRELYDRKSDPFETRNVAKKKRYHKLGQEMMRRTRALRECSGPTCRRNFGKLPRP